MLLLEVLLGFEVVVVYRCVFANDISRIIAPFFEDGISCRGLDPRSIGGRIGPLDVDIVVITSLTVVDLHISVIEAVIGA